MSWIYYLLEANCYLAVFFLLYYLVFRKETYYQLNRVYLLISSALAFIIPVVQLGFLRPVHDYAQNTPVITTVAYPTVTIKAQGPAPMQIWHVSDYFFSFYMLIVSILLFHLAWKVYRLVRLSRSNRKTTIDSYQLVETVGGQDAFSFFNYLFINPAIPFKHTIINHELIHMKQRHSLDVLFFELLKIINWFNPVVYMLQYSIKEVHEFIADSETVKQEQNAAEYTDFLIKNAYGIDGDALANTFFNKSLLKQRIIMLHQKRSGNLARLKILLAVPVFGVLLCFSTAGVSKTYGWIDLAPHRKANEKPVRPFTGNDTAKQVDRFTSKGYKYEETGYLVNNKANFRVIITEKNGTQKSYFKNSVTPAERSLLKQKYGYTFPAMAIYPKLPPPPPIAVKDKKLPAPPIAVKDKKLPAPPIAVKDKKLPPPPPMPPAKQKKLHRLPPPLVTKDTMASIHKRTNQPEKVIINYHNDTAKAVGRAGSTSSVYLVKEKNVSPLILVNGVKYKLSAGLRPGGHIYIDKSDSTIAYAPGDKRAKQKWGADAENGVFELFGHPTLTIR